jgi:hypothetical protein
MIPTKFPQEYLGVKSILVGNRFKKIQLFIIKTKKGIKVLCPLQKIMEKISCA